jgi:signal transduction histidine kinase
MSRLLPAPTAGRMGVMRRSGMPVRSAERTGRRGRAGQTFAQPIAAAAALLVLIWALSDGFWPTWPLWTIAALLGLGLLAGPLARLAGGQAVQGSAHSAHTVTAVATLLVLTFWLPNAHSRWQISPLWVIALLLGLGLLADPLARLARGQAVYRSAQPIAAVAALLVLIWELSTDGYYSYTASPGTLHTIDKLPMGALRVVVVILCLGLVAGRLASGQAMRRFVQPVAAVAALVVLLLTLASPPAPGIQPGWPLWWMSALLGLGLVADPLARLASRPREKVLSRRVDELSRTRRGALDVQATELRRIERDLHDGAQARLVALSIKLGRAEDRYRDDAETAALLREAREDAAAAIRELRELARGIAPPVLADLGLEAAVRSLAQRSGAEVTVSGQLERRPVPAVEIAAYFVVAESLTNAAKHAPGARVEVRLDERGGDLFVEITDFGPGGANPAGGGLTGLRQRAEALDGALHVTSPAGVGTQVEAVLPCEW